MPVWVRSVVTRLRARIALAWICLRIRLKVLCWWWRVPTGVLSLLEPVPVYVVNGPLHDILEYLLTHAAGLRVDASGQVKDADGIPVYAPGTGPCGIVLGWIGDPRNPNELLEAAPLPGQLPAEVIPDLPTDAPPDASDSRRLH